MKPTHERITSFYEKQLLAECERLAAEMERLRTALQSMLAATDYVALDLPPEPFENFTRLMASRAIARAAAAVSTEPPSTELT